VSLFRLCRSVVLAGHAVALFLIVLWPAPASADPEAIARLFVKRVQAGDVAGAKKLFGDPKLRSQPRAGDDAYFVYESGESRNLAFLVGRPFDVGPLSTRESRSDWFIIDGTLYAQVTVPLSFSPERYQPYLLPPPTAFGQKVPFSAFMNFVAAPETEMRDVPLRLRPGVESGLLRPPGPRTAVPPPPAPPGARPAMSSSEGFGLIGMPVPRDPAPVLLPSDEALTPEQLKRLLPRLRRGTLELHLVRHGRLGSFTISLFEFSEFVVTTPRGEASLKVKW
jgi:hypothetical protein